MSRERLIPRKDLSFYPGSESPPCPTPPFISCGPELKFEPPRRMIYGARDGIAVVELHRA